MKHTQATAWRKLLALFHTGHYNKCHGAHYGPNGYGHTGTASGMWFHEEGVERETGHFEQRPH